MASTEVTTGGHIEVITGSMFSGKTEELIRRLERAKIAGQEVEVFKPSIDDRYSEEEIDSHAGSEWEARVVDEDEDLEDEPTVVVGADEKYQARCRHCHELRTD